MSLERWSLWGLGVVVGCVGLGVLSYLVGSFVLMRPHTGPRRLGEILRDLLGELGTILVTQPLLPLFYFVGRRMGGRPGGVPVVFVHGYSQNRVDFFWQRGRFARLGPLYGFNYPWWASSRDNARRLGAFVEAVRRETGARSVDVVCHSMGGLVALELLRVQGEAAHVRRCVTFASPHGGVVFRGPIVGACAGEIREGSGFLRTLAEERLRVPVLSVYSRHDNVVHPPSTSSLAARGGRDVVLPRGGHLAMLFDPIALDEASRFLAERVREAAPARAAGLESGSVGPGSGSVGPGSGSVGPGSGSAGPGSGSVGGSVGGPE